MYVWSLYCIGRYFCSLAFLDYFKVLTNVLCQMQMGNARVPIPALRPGGAATSASTTSTSPVSTHHFYNYRGIFFHVWLIIWLLHGYTCVGNATPAESNCGRPKSDVSWRKWQTGEILPPILFLFSRAHTHVYHGNHQTWYHICKFCRWAMLLLASQLSQIRCIWA